MTRVLTELARNLGLYLSPDLARLRSCNCAKSENMEGKQPIGRSSHAGLGKTMDFAPTEEQRMTCDVARKFFAREFPLARLREVEAQGLGAFMPVYRKMGELGFLGIGVAESCGGSGGGWLDLALFAESRPRSYPRCR
jgi:hypothetical protein